MEDKPEIVARVLVFMVVGLVFLFALRKGALGRALPLPDRIDRFLHGLPEKSKSIYIIVHGPGFIGRYVRSVMSLFVLFWLLNWGSYAMVDAFVGSRTENPALASLLDMSAQYFHFFLSGTMVFLLLSSFLEKLRSLIRPLSWHVLLWPLCAAYLGFLTLFIASSVVQFNLTWMTLSDGTNVPGAAEYWQAFGYYFGVILLYFMMFGLPILLVPNLVVGTRRPLHHTLQVLWPATIRLLALSFVILIGYLFLSEAAIDDVLSEMLFFLRGSAHEVAYSFLNNAASYLFCLLMAALIAAAFLRERDALPALASAAPPPG